MDPLPWPDQNHLQAAEGWLELGNAQEANQELEQITPSLRAHPAVLDLRWKIYAEAKKWPACLDIATAITKLAPDAPTGRILALGGRPGPERNGVFRVAVSA
jgi:hypothetical protein